MSKAGLRVCRKQERYRLVRGEEGGIVEEADRFLSALEIRGLSPRTVRAYAFDLLLLYRWLDEEKRTIEELGQSDLLAFVQIQRINNASPSSINRRLVVTGLLYRFLTGEHIGAGAAAHVGVSLPAAHYKGRGRDRGLGLHKLKTPRHRALRVKIPQTIIEPLTARQVRLLIASFKRYRDIAIAYLMLLCGLRSREVLALKTDDVGFGEGRLRVSGKGDKERVLPLPPLLLGYLYDYLRFERPPVCHTNALFVVMQGRRRGHPMTTSGLRSLFRHRRRDKQIDNANPHRLRHTFGTDMARCRVRLPTLQKMMGHSDSKMTLRYINLSMEDVAAEFLRASSEIRKRYAGK